MNDYDVGIKVLKAFYNKAKLKISFQEMLNRIQPNLVKQRIEVDGLGFGVNSANSEYTFLSDSRINTAMEKLALKSAGKIPNKIGTFFNFLSNEATNIVLIDAVVATAAGTATDLISGVQAVGDSIITTGKIVNFLLPAIALVFLYFWINSKTNNQLSKAVKGLK